MKREEWLRERACTRKRAFASTFHAECYAVNILKRPDALVYKCKYCEEYHLSLSGGGNSNHRKIKRVV